MTVADRPSRTATPPGVLAARRVAIAELDPVALFGAARAAGLEVAVWLQPSRGVALVGVGAAWSVESAGPERFAIAAERWRGLAPSLLAADPGARPRLLGGLGFSGRRPPAGDPWEPFGAARLVLPELLWARDGAATVATVVGPGAAAGELPGRLAEVVAVARGASAGAATTPRLRAVARLPERSAWERLVAMYAGAVGRGRLDKVVLARRLELAADDGAAIPVEAALRTLAASAPESTVYGFARGGVDGPVFLGATPERLVRTEGRRFETVAIAGSAPRSTDAAEDARLAAALLSSEKDREEHAVVVAMLRESLAPLVEELRVGREPTLLELRSIRHLMTPVAGTLAADAGLLGLAERLHPTPAVGGEPRDLALELIREHEGFERGWYAGPVGWVGADGDGDLAVALRCAIVSGARATLFAGCGIVADSDPGREWDESETKLRVVAGALGRLEEVAR